MIRQIMGAAGAVLVLAGMVLAQADDANKKKGVVKLVDPDKGKMLVAIITKDGTKIVEYDIGKDVKFQDEKGKPLKGGLKNDVFKTDKTNRNEVPIAITFNKDGSMKSVKLTPPPPK